MCNPEQHQRDVTVIKSCWRDLLSLITHILISLAKYWRHRWLNKTAMNGGGVGFIHRSCCQLLNRTVAQRLNACWLLTDPPSFPASCSILVPVLCPLSQRGLTHYAPNSTAAHELVPRWGDSVSQTSTGNPPFRPLIFLQCHRQCICPARLHSNLLKDFFSFFFFGKTNHPRC